MSIFFSCCIKFSKQKLPQEEKIKAFFEELLLEYGGAYTLFGTKPLTIEDFYENPEQVIQEMDQYLQNHPSLEVIRIDRQLDEGWKALKNLKSQIISQNFILKDIQIENSKSIVLININNTIDMLNKYYFDFKNVLNRDFNPLDLIEDFKKGKLEPWQKLLSHYKTLGILAGYGYQNSCLFVKRFTNPSPCEKPSEDNDPRISAECLLNNRPFRIPLFVMIDEEESVALVQKYKQEREIIKKIYQGKDFLKVSLDQLGF